MTTTQRSTAQATITAGDLTAAFARVKPFVEARSKVPAFTAVRIHQHAGGLVVDACSHGDYVRAFIDDAQAAGVDCVVELKALQGALRGLKPRKRDTITLQHDEHAVTVEHDGVRVTLPTVALDQWPIAPSFETDAVRMVADAAAFEDALQRVAPCASTDETRPILTQLAVAEQDGWPVLVATDSYRLAIVRVPGAGMPSAPKDPLLLPAGPLKASVKRISGEQPVTLFDDASSPSHVVLVTPGATYRLRLGAGTYPQWQQLIPDPKPEDIHVTVDGGDLAAMLDQAKKTLGRNDPARLVVESGEMSVLTDTFEGRVRDGIDGTGLQVGVNPAFLASAVRAVGAGDVRLEVRSPLRPLVVRHDDDVALVMPIRLRD